MKFYPRLLQVLPFLLLATLANSAPLSEPGCPSCPTPSPPSVLATRAPPGVPVVLPEAEIWSEIYNSHLNTWMRLVAEQRRLGFFHVSQLEHLPPSGRQRILELQAEAKHAADGMQHAQLQVEKYIQLHHLTRLSKLQ
ncbi:hypothetical protein A4X06_0g1714 [Tilletia controversa]|uniref:Uncharacterized protein n=1 Tax=Tilletia controversa TaxID=13291 RepID=A0A8X7MXT8_9BASI|nr:hypothetical protein CF328_g1249 [Tilletia controversa]KAE8253080.1 hypothetical protein A4X06_0g1714 [Tilletia controversa]